MSAPKGANRARACRPRGGAHATRLRGLLAAGLAVCGLGAFASSANAEEIGAVSFPGAPLTVSIGPLGQCQSSYSPGNGNYFEPSDPVGDCGLFLAFPKEGAGQPAGLQGTTWGFRGSAGPGLSGFEGSEEYLPVSHSEVTGAGTSASPYMQTTVFEVTTAEMRENNETGYALVTDTTTYVSGEAQFTSSYDVKNLTKGKLYFRAIYAGDLYVTGSDYGTGVFLGGPPAFIGGQNSEAGILGGFVEAAAPSPPWSAYQEGCWNEAAGEIEGGRCTGASTEDSGIWHIVRTSVESEHAFNNTIDPALIDNGVGVEWDQFRQEGLPENAEQTFTVINRTGVPSGLKISPTNQTLTQGQTETINVSATNTANEPYAGKNVRYAVSGANPQEGAVTLNSAGQAQISYIGHNAGPDTIQMYVDLGGTGVKNNSDPSATAQVTVTGGRPPHPHHQLHGAERQSEPRRHGNDHVRADAVGHGDADGDGPDRDDRAQGGDRGAAQQEVPQGPGQDQAQVPSPDHGRGQDLSARHGGRSADLEREALEQGQVRAEEGQDGAPDGDPDVPIGPRGNSDGAGLPRDGQGQAQASPARPALASRATYRNVRRGVLRGAPPTFGSHGGRGALSSAARDPTGAYQGRSPALHTMAS
jgi:hypothetical protein